MNELDEHWAEMLNEAVRRASAAGHSDVADYLRLKAENDAVREVGVRWLLDSFIELATASGAAAAGVKVERVDPHSFSYNGANIVGALLRMRHGVRCLTVEAGWTRTPGDGFMRGGALAAARVVHFGMTKHGAEISLVRSPNGVAWTEAPRADAAALFDGERLRSHFELFFEK